MPGLIEEMKKKVNRPVPELPLADEETSLMTKPTARLTASSPATGSNGGRGDHPVQTLSDAIAHFQQDAPTCPNCGHVAVRNGACYKCLNCGESLGCS